MSKEKNERVGLKYFNNLMINYFNYFGTLIYHLAVYFLQVSARVSLKVASKVSFKARKLKVRGATKKFLRKLVLKNF